MNFLPLPLQVVENGSFELELLLLDVKRHHPRFFFTDGDLLLVSHSVDFRVHSDRLIHQSTVLESMLAPLASGLAQSRGVIYLPTLGDDPSDWTSLLAVIYDDYAAMHPTLYQLLGTIRLSHRYKFAGLELWSAKRLRTDFFPNPEYFQIDPVESERAAQKLQDILQVIAASHHDPIEDTTLVIAFYSIARRDPSTLPVDIIETSQLTWHAWNLVATARQRMTRGIKRLVNTIPDVAWVERPRAVSHCKEKCEKALTSWVSNAEKAQPDILQVLRWLQNNMVSGPICSHCVEEAQEVVEQERETFYRIIPTYFGFKEDERYEWEFEPDKLEFLSMNFQP